MKLKFTFIAILAMLSSFSFTANAQQAVEVSTLEALQTALSGENETVLITETIVIPQGETVVLDLNGKTVTRKDETNQYALRNLGTLTIQDTEGNGSINARGIYNGYGDGAANVATAKITVLSGTINAKGTNGGGAAIFNYGVADIQGGTFTSVASYAIALQTGSTMTIGENAIITGGINSWQSTLTVNGGTISNDKSGKHVVYAGQSIVTINGGTFYNSNSGNATIMASGATAAVEINGGTFGIKDGRVPGDGNTWTSCLTDTQDSATMTVNGGTFNGGFRVQSGTTMTINGGSFNDIYGSGYNIYGTAIVNGGTFTDAAAKNFAEGKRAEGCSVVENPDGTFSVGKPVATLAELQTALAADSELAIIVTAQIVIPQGETVVLDLNGKIVNSVFNGTSTTNHIYALSNKGTLTIQDSKGNGSINSRGIYNYGSLTLNAGAINAIDGNGGYAVNNQNGSTFVMNGGVVAATCEDDHQSNNGGYDATALKVPAGCTATLNGGTINNVCDFTYAIDAAGTLNIPETSAIIVNGTHGAIYVSGGETTINAGTFQIPADEYSRTDNVLYVSGGSLVVNGGTFIGDSDTAAGGSCLYDAAGKAVVNGGTFKGSSGGDVWGTTGTTIKGGTFENLTEKQHIADGYELGEDGKVTSSIAYVAKIGEQGYATLSEAFAAVTDDNQTVVLLADVTENLAGAYLRGNITTENGAKVTVNLTNSDWVYCPYTFVIGENVTLNVPALFYYAGGSVINGTVVAGAYYQRYAGTKLTINEPGSMTVTGETCVIRLTDGDANAGIYVNGDTNNETVGLNLSVAYFYQGMIYAKDANIKTAVYWQTNETDGQGSANLVLDNSTLNVSVNEHNFKATGNSTVTLTNGSSIVIAGGFETGANTAVSVDATSSITDKNGQVKFGLSGEGTEANPFLISSVDDLVLFRNSVNAGEKKYNAEGVYVALGANIDLAGVANWSPIGTWDYSFDANFDGKGKKIMNLKMSDNTAANGEAYLGFFGITANNEIKNLVIENVTIESAGQIVAAAIAYPYYTKVSDITVCGNIAIKGGNYTAGVLAYTRLCQNASNLAVVGNEGSYIRGAQVVGGVIADLQMNYGLVADYSNFSAEGVKVSGTKMVGGISGIIATQTLNGAAVKNVTLSSGDSRVGTIAGAFGGTSTISNVTIENVTGATAIVGATYDGGEPVQILEHNGVYTIKSQFLSGEGTEENPYLISSVEDILFFRNSVNAGETKYNAEGVYVALGANIDLTGIDWSVNIGDDCAVTFDGIFDGKGYTISNLTATETATKADGYICTGLFGAIYDKAVVKNFTLENVTINAPFTGNNVSAVVGFAYACKGSIENVKVVGVNIDAPKATGVGAIVGYDYYSPALKVENCIVDGADITAAAYAGGLVGYASSKIAMNNNTVEDVTVSATASVGAVAGIMLGGGSATDNTVKNVTLTANGALWANSAAVVAGTISGGSVTVSNTTVENVTANGAEARIVGGILVEKPTTAIAKVQAQIGDVYYTTLQTAATAAKENETITLIADVEATEALNINCALDLNGHSLMATIAPVALPEGYAALPNLDGKFVIGAQPTATVNNLGMTTVAAGEYSIWDGSFDSNTEDDGDMPLSFVMQFLADQDAEDMATSPFADWYGDFVLTFTGLENGSFTADSCYLAGHYGSFGWVKIPVDGMVIEDGVRYPVMLGVGLGQKYDYICSSVEDFKCALYLAPEILEANPNIQVKLELGVVDNSKGQDAATEALMNNENVYSVTEYTYDALDFDPSYIAEFVIDDANSVDYTFTEEKTVGTLTYKRTLIEGIWNPLYLPFEIDVEELVENYDIAYYNQMHSYDSDNNGSFDSYEMEVAYITSGTLRANYPYFIRPKSADDCELEYVANDVTLSPAVEKKIQTSSVANIFTLSGTHKAMNASELAGCYAISVDGDWSATAGLKAHRLYLKIEENDNSPFATTRAKSIRIVVAGETDGTTGIEGVEYESTEAIYNLTGRRVQETVKGGIYIINGKKVLVK